MTDIPIHDAATIVLLRKDAGRVRVLMGQRGAQAVFMPNKFVFPGGRVDACDCELAGAIGVSDDQRGLLAEHASPDVVASLSNAAIRELWEETGLVLAAPGGAQAEVPEDWRGFYAKGLVPNGAALSFFFRAITPPGRPRRFDARFFIADAADILGDLDNFSDASGELSHLQWIELSDVRNFSLPFITEIVLAEVEDIVASPDAPRPIPFFRHGQEGSSFRAIRRDRS